MHFCCVYLHDESKLSSNANCTCKSSIKNNKNQMLYFLE
nr:MAG TPA: hypothetical protein [Caudoviricetes sp.]